MDVAVFEVLKTKLNFSKKKKKKKKDWFEFDIYSETSVLRVTSFSQEKKTLTNNDHLHR